MNIYTIRLGFWKDAVKLHIKFYSFSIEYIVSGSDLRLVSTAHLFGHRRHDGLLGTYL